MRHSPRTIKDATNLLERGSLGLRVHEVDPDELDADPELIVLASYSLGVLYKDTYSVEECKIPVLRQPLPRNGISLPAHSERSLDRDVHNDKTLAAKTVGQDFKRVCNEQTGPGERVEDAEDPDERDLGVAGAGVCLV